MEENSKGSKNLKEEIIEKGWCVSCGLCVGICPYIKAVDDKVAVVYNCEIEEGNCYKVCPCTQTNYLTLRNSIMNFKNYDGVLGGYDQIVIARAVEQKSRDSGQYGGVVTALTSFALEKGLIDAALLTNNSINAKAEPLVAHTVNEVHQAAGSKYLSCPTIKALYNHKISDKEMLVVGRPCQVVGLRKLQHYTDIPQGRNIQYLLGLFCFWALDYDLYTYLNQNVEIKSISRMDIPKERGLLVEGPWGSYEMPLEKTRSFIKKGCHSCIDPTSELADISIGSTESDPHWCTLIVRTSRGAELFNKAVQEKVIEVRSYPEKLMEQLKIAVNNKKQRVLLS